MPDLIAIRSELMRGDLRSLYVGWLNSIVPDIDGDQPEPPVPPGLSKLSGAQQQLATFLRIETALLDAAAVGDSGKPPAEPSEAEMGRWIKGLPLLDKETYLVRFLAEEGDIRLRADLAKRFRVETAPKTKAKAPVVPTRKVADLIAARDVLDEEREREAAAKAAADKTKRDREQAEARAKHLDALARRESSAWNEVEVLIASKLPKKYDQAVELLVDLRELASRSGRVAAAYDRVRELRQLHAGKPSLIKRFDKARLGT